MPSHQPWQRPSPLSRYCHSQSHSPLPLTLSPPNQYPLPSSMFGSSSSSSSASSSIYWSASSAFSSSSSPAPSSIPPPPPFTEIIPRLYLGDHSAAENASILSSLGITHVLSAMRGSVYLPHDLRLRHTQVSIEDLPFAELAAHLPHTTSFIKDAMRDPNARVLVHCMQGVSRSASVVAAYLMAAFDWSPQQAVQFVKSKRWVAEPNSGFVAQLSEYGKVLRDAATQEQGVAAARPGVGWGH